MIYHQQIYRVEVNLVNTVNHVRLYDGRGCTVMMLVLFESGAARSRWDDADAVRVVA